MNTSFPPTQGGESTDREPLGESFMYHLGRTIKEKWQWWYAIPVLVVATLVGVSYGPWYSITLVVVSTVFGLGYLYLYWVSELPEKARKVIVSLVALFFWGLYMNENNHHWHDSSLREDQIGQVQNSRLHQTGSHREGSIAYWTSTVAPLHRYRFQIPSGDEPTGPFLQRFFQEYQQALAKAQTTSSQGVDPDLVKMVLNHWKLDHRHLQFKSRVDELLKEENIPADTVPIEKRKAEWFDHMARLEADPTILDRLPESRERDMLIELLAIMRGLEIQLREIEIMQAVLQERYPGSQFPLPVVESR